MIGMTQVNYQQNWSLLRRLVGREIKARYKQSILGYGWVLLVPLARLLVLSLVFSYFLRIDTMPIPYPVFLFVALVPWQFTSSAITAATNSLVVNANLITKIRLPRVIFPLSALGVKSIDAGLSGILLLLMLLFWAHTFSAAWVWLPMVMMVHFGLVMGISLILSAVNVYFRDVENMLEVLLMMWMYLSPVVYPPEFVPKEILPIMLLNPMFGIINSYRNVLLYGLPPAWQSFGWASGVSLVILVLGILCFKKLSRNFADVI